MKSPAPTHSIVDQLYLDDGYGHTATGLTDSFFGGFTASR